MTWALSIVDGEFAIRDIIFDLLPADARFCFNLLDDTDVGSRAAGPLFKQNDDFFLVEAEVDDVERAGPSAASPTRCYGTLSLSLMSKNSSRDLHHKRELEGIAKQFANKTIRGIRFRTFQPLSTGQLMGFTTYSGVINFDYEVTQEQ